MRLWTIFAVVLAPALAAGGAPPAHKRAVVSQNQMLNFKGGLLYKSGLQTSCEVALISISAAFVAANCFNFTSDGKLDASIEYAVYIDQRNLGKDILKSPLATADITVHPSYDPATLANNIAMVQFNRGMVAPYVSYISTNPPPDTTQAYARRSVDDAGQRWNLPLVASQPEDSSDCTDSAIYLKNRDSMACTGNITPSIYTESCGIPYGTMYQVTDDQIVLAGIYSHSVLLGNSTCSNTGGWHNYYTLLAPYVGFAANVLKIQLDVYSNLTPIKSTTTSIVSMNNTDQTAPSKGTVVGGDFYRLQGADDPAETSSESGPGPEPDADSSSESKTKSKSTDDSEGFTKTQTIVVAVVVPVGVILISVGAFIVYRIWLAKRQDHAWDPHRNAAELQDAAMELDIGGGPDVERMPPEYDTIVHSAPAPAARITPQKPMSPEKD
ncbi:hypothetical protein H4R18_003088 [Coemansia javaensis]|uniref:Peptidase S1 domain-containing protein n=1 Tax=Coemansia javaensis TaxID=2761396 RepID=A0A9W8HD69_9FUNG|nr:hypothetical protein H4R18_003088 [Coemansia javaensis]